MESMRSYLNAKKGGFLLAEDQTKLTFVATD